MANKSIDELEEERLVDYIGKELNKGFDIKAIKKILVEYGHPKAAVEGAIKVVLQKRKQEGEAKPAPILMPKISFPNFSWKTASVIFASLLLVIGVIAVVSLTQSDYCERKELKDVCFLIKNRCKSIPNENERYLCIFRLAKSANEKNLCKEMGSKELINKCYNDLKLG